MDKNIMFYANTKPMSGFREYYDKKNNVYQEIDDRIDYRIGSIVRWFKRDALPEEQKKANAHLYRIIAFGVNNQTGEEMVIYTALYGSFNTFVETLKVFKTKINKEEYPDTEQVYQYEVVKYYTDEGEGVY